MKNIDDILVTKRPFKQTGFTHADSKYLLKIPHEVRSPEAIEILLKQHQKLAYNVAIKIWRKYKGKISSVLDFDDILSAANEGLFVAIKRYNYLYNTEFSTFAIHWIRQKAQRELDNNYSQVRIPIHFVNTTRKAQNNEGHGNSNSLSSLTIHRFSPNCSLDSTVSDDDVTLKELLTYKNMNYIYPDTFSDNPEIILLRKDLRERVLLLINAIPNKRNRSIILRRFGLDDFGGDRTLEEVGKEFGVTRERIRQVCDKGFKKVAISKYVNQQDLVE